jgi:hypothetical protein
MKLALKVGSQYSVAIPNKKSTGHNDKFLKIKFVKNEPVEVDETLKTSDNQKLTKYLLSMKEIISHGGDTIERNIFDEIKEEIEEDNKIDTNKKGAK